MLPKQTEDHYPTVGERLNLQHQEYNQITINTEIIEYHHLELAICRATITTPKGSFNGSGVASLEKDADMMTSLLEIAETRAVSRALRFSGALVEYTGREEIPKPTKSAPNPPISSGTISNGQKRAIERMAKDKGWDIIQAVRRILANNSIEALDHLNKQDASTVIQRMRSALVA
jgi:hypothetical protein